MYSLKDKVIVITGASSGIGKALGDAALQRGAKLAVCARNIKKLEAAFDSSNGENILMYKADVSIEDDCKGFINTVLNKWGRVDVLMNNAGMTMRTLFEEAELKVIKELMDVNFWGMVYCTKYALPAIRAHKGVVLGVSSIAGFRGLPARTGYSSSKFAMQGFLEALRTELLATGTHVMWVSPGFTASNIRNTALTADGSIQQETPLDEAKLMTAERCAEIIVNAVEKRKRTVVMTAQGKLAVWLNKLFPQLADKLVFKHFLNEPDSPLLKYHKPNQ